METTGLYLTTQGDEKLTQFLDGLYKNESIHYIGLFKEGQLIYLLSDFEGYLPVTPSQTWNRIMDTPVGKIFQVSALFGEKSKYRLFIGFDFDFLSLFEGNASRNLLYIAGLFSVMIFFIIILMLYFDKKFFRKELELVKEKEEKERFKELSLLTSEIAHEIKNPLNSIYLSFNALEKYIQPEDDAVYYRDAIKNEIKRINGIIQSYSELSKEIRPDIHEIHVEEFSREFNLLLEEETMRRGIHLEIIPENLEYVHTDPNLLKQILLNMVKNSMEAGATVIGVRWFLQKNFMAIEVRDNGSGINETVAESIFKPYFSTKTVGMGLGLHITRRLLQALKGEIRLISSRPGNTVFRVLVPCKGVNGRVFSKRSESHE